MQKPLTPKQRRVLSYIDKFTSENSYPPSLREISTFLRKSLSTAQHFVEELKSKGHLHKTDNVARSFITAKERSGQIFLLGKISAGKPIEPFENPEPLDVPLSMIGSTGSYYALRVKGNSMIEDNIQENDVVIVKHQKTARNNQVVVAITEHGATLKVFRNNREKPYLSPRNKKYKNIYPNKIEIRGIFCGLIRNEVND